MKRWTDRIRELDPRAWAWACATLALVLYLPSLANGFAYDDLHIIVRDQTLHSLRGVGDLLTRPYWPGDQGVEFGLWRPVTSISLALIWVVSDGAPWAFHLVNVVLHAAITAGVVVLGARFFGRGTAAVAGLLFAVHPVHVEAVANGVGIAELLASGFVLLALERVTREDDGSRLVQARDLGFLYLLAFLSKEGAVVLPGLLFLVDAGRGRMRDPRRLLRERGHLYGVLLVVGVGVLWVRTSILGGVASPMPALGAGILTEIPRIHTVGEIWAEQLRLIAFPFRLSPDYAPDAVSITTVWTGMGIAAMAAVLCFLAGAALWYRSALRGRFDPARLAFPLGILWYVVAVSPITNLVFVAGVLVAERTLYLPSVGAAFAIAGLGAVVPRGGRRLAAVAVGVLVLAWGARAVTYQPEWKDQDTLFAHMLEVVPESGRSAWVRGDLLVQSDRVTEALLEYRIALAQLGPEYVFLTETGRRLLSASRPELARPFLLRAWDERPDLGAAPQLLTVVASRQEDWEAVEQWAARTIERSPDDLASRHLLSVSYAARERWAEAARAREGLIAAGDRGMWQQWYWLTELRGRAGEVEGARAAADSARLRAPGETQVRQIDSVLAVVESLPGLSQNSGMLQDTTHAGGR